MSAAAFQHIRLRMLKDDVVLVEILTKDLQGPQLAQELGAELTQVTQQNWANRLLVDCGQVRFLSSTGFAVLFGLVKKIKEAKRQLKFCKMEQALRLGAEIVGLDKVAEIHETQESAIKAFSPA
jgi:anti-sigma B factor antagonist